MTLQAKETKGKIEVLANSLETTKDKLQASGGVVVYYEDALIKSQRVSFDKKTKMLIFDGKVEMIGYAGTKEHSEHMEIDTQDKEVKFKNLFLASKNDVWLLSKDAKKIKEKYHLGASMISSCDVSDPLWKILFKKALYDSEKKYMDIYQAKIYFWDIPVLYTPYLGFSTQSERTSGFLFPLFGYRSDEGLLYEQPIFWAINPSLDIEFNPQVRSKRSLGGYATLRFVDSFYSSGTFRLGYFKDFESYQSTDDNNKLVHYGAEFNYQSSNVLGSYKPNSFNEGLYINATYLNDIDYLNLQKSRLTHFGTYEKQESRVNYFLHNNDVYLGLNAKYFIDTSVESNAKTLQVLPSLQWHKYLTHLVWDNLTYSMDGHLNNISRRDGLTLKEVALSLPFSFDTTWFEDRLKLSLREEMHYNKFYFDHGAYDYAAFEYYSNIHTVKLFSDLTKGYENYVHVLQPFVEYIKPGNESKSPDDFLKLTSEQKELFAVGLPEEQYQLGVNHYLYDKKNVLKFFQRMSQIYYPNRLYKWADLENEMRYHWKQWKFYNALTYSYAYKKVRESSSRVRFAAKEYDFSVGHSYKQRLEDEVQEFRESNALNASFGYRWDDQIRLHGSIAYDLSTKASTQWVFGGEYKRDCWRVSGSLRQDIRATSQGPETDTSFYFQMEFIPFGGIGTGSLN